MRLSISWLNQVLTSYIINPISFLIQYISTIINITLIMISRTVGSLINKIFDIADRCSRFIRKLSYWMINTVAIVSTVYLAAGLTVLSNIFPILFPTNLMITSAIIASTLMTALLLPKLNFLKSVINNNISRIVGARNPYRVLNEINNRIDKLYQSSKLFYRNIKNRIFKVNESIEKTSSVFEETASIYKRNSLVKLDTEKKRQDTIEQLAISRRTLIDIKNPQTENHLIGIETISSLEDAMKNNLVANSQNQTSINYSNSANTSIAHQNEILQLVNGLVAKSDFSNSEALSILRNSIDGITKSSQYRCDEYDKKISSHSQVAAHLNHARSLVKQIDESTAIILAIAKKHNISQNSYEITTSNTTENIKTTCSNVSSSKSGIWQNNRKSHHCPISLEQQKESVKAITAELLVMGGK